MSRNAESHFAVNPTRIDISRSTFDRDSSHKTTFNVGDIIPFYVDEVLPGDTFSVDTSKVVRMQTLLTPVMDNMYLDTYYFFVPNRLTWVHWREFMGENTQSAWIPTVEYEVPQLTAPVGGWSAGTIADYMGIPTEVENLSVNALPFRAYALVMNEWFRDENLSDPINVPVTDATVQGSNGATFIVDVAKGGKPYTAAKFHDYFTSCLPAPQKGPDVTIPIGSGLKYPVYALKDTVPARSDTTSIGFNSQGGNYAQGDLVLGFKNAKTPLVDAHPGLLAGQTYDPYPNPPNFSSISPSNLWAVGDGTVAAATINQLRLAFQIQKLYERDARGGTRYIELLKSHFGVTSPDARLQRPEYLGGNRVPININQVVQNSSTEASGTPQGNTAAYSLTTDSHSDFTKSFVEHGFVIGVMVARYNHTYQQGVERFWSRRDRFDYYWPVFANIGEQAVLNREIYASGTSKDAEVFGYQEAWADYRYKPSRVSGEMRSNYAQSLDVWHWADDYKVLPSLSDSWIRENKATINRSLAVSDNLSAQLFCDIFVRNKCTRAMPLYSIPGLIDHH